MSASKAQRAKTAARRAQAIALALAGMDWQTIADRLGYASRGAAHTDVDRAMKAALAEMKETADLRRFTEVQRLNRLQAAVWPKAVKGDTKSVAEARQIIAARCKIEGTEAPTVVQLEHRLDLEAQIVADALGAALDSLDLNEEQRAAAIEAAQARLLDNAPESSG